MEKTIAGSSSVELLDSDLVVKSENCTDLFGQAVCNGKPTEHEGVTNPNRITAGDTPPSCSDANDLHLIDNRMHEMNDHDGIHGSTEISRPPDTSFSRTSGLFYCLKCGCRFRKLDDLVKHGKRKCSVRCYTCGKQFERVAALVRHKRAENHSGKPRQRMPRETRKPVRCLAAGNSFSRDALEHQEVANPHRSTAGNTSSSCREANSVQSIDDSKHEMNDQNTGSTEICQPPDTSFSQKSGLFYCLKCGCRFRKLENLVQHGKMNCSVRCYTCGKQFQRVAALVRHKRAENHSEKPRQRMPREPRKPVQCQADGNSSRRIAEYQEVENPHQSTIGKISPSCGEANDVQSVDDRKHEMNDHDTGSMEICLPPDTSFSRKSGLFYCLKCGCRFRKVENLVKHLKINCSVRCCTCGKQFERVAALQRHRRAENHMSASSRGKPRQRRPREAKKPLQCVCSHCGHAFKNSTQLKSHIFTHTGERPFQCRVAGCTKRFAQQSTRTFHERTHSDEMPHICAVCGRRFKHAVGVYLHMSLHTGHKPYHCTSCPMTFRKACNLQRHLHRHSDERPYLCTECPKRFKTKKTLERHKLALHSDEIPYHCSMCDKGFKTPGNLNIHMRVHTGDRPFICAVCGVRFAYAGSLKSHMQAHAGTD